MMDIVTIEENMIMDQNHFLKFVYKNFVNNVKQLKK
jgi:hypothetical protein